MIRSKLLLFASVALLGFSCSTTKGVEGAALPEKKIDELTSTLKALSDQKVDYFYSKISTKYKDSSQNLSFKTSIRMVPDSATGIVISFARIPMVNAYIDSDSVQMTNNRDKCYMQKSISFLKEAFKLDFSLHNMEELFLGLPVAFDPEQEYFQQKSDQGYVVCTHNKRDLKKLAKGNLEELVMFYTLSEDLQQLKSIRIVSPTDGGEVVINYKERILVDEILMPKLVHIQIRSEKQDVNINLDYKKTRINQVEHIHFVIPENYEECK